MEESPRIPGTWMRFVFFFVHLSRPVRLLRPPRRRLDRKDSAAKKNARSPLVARSRFVPVLCEFFLSHSLLSSLFPACKYTRRRIMDARERLASVSLNGSFREPAERKRERESKGDR